MRRIAVRLLGAAALVGVCIVMLLQGEVHQHRVAHVESEGLRRATVEQPQAGRDRREDQEFRAERADEKTVCFVGRVLDTHRRPQINALVEVLDAAGEQVAEAQTGSDGTFSVSILHLESPPREPLTVVASLGYGGEVPPMSCARLIARGLGDAKEIVKLGDLILRPSRSLLVKVVTADSLPARALVSISVGPQESPVAISRRCTDETGTALFGCVPATPVSVEAAVIGYGACSAEVPSWETVLELAVDPGRNVTIRVLESSTNIPIPNAELSVTRLLQERNVGYEVPSVLLERARRTNDEGVLAIQGVPIGWALRACVVSAPGYTIIEARKPHVLIEEDSSGGTVYVLPPRSVVWPISSNGEVVPPDGEQLEVLSLSGDPMPTISAAVTGGSILAEGVPSFTFKALAKASDGSIGELYAERAALACAPVRFYRHRVVRVQVKDELGPVSEVGVALRASGGRMLSQVTSTDPSGCATIEVGYPWPTGGLESSNEPQAFDTVDVVLLPFWPQLAGDRVSASLSLVRETSLVEASLSRERVVTVRFVLNGEARLPEWYLVKLPGIEGAPWVERPERGEAVYRLRPLAAGDLPPATVFAAGFPRMQVPIRSGVCTVVLERSGRVSALIALPRDGVCLPLLQQRDARGKWVDWQGSQRVTESEDEAAATWRASGVKAGRYRLVDALSGAASPGFELDGGDRDEVVTLDCSASGWAEGHVQAELGIEKRSLWAKVVDLDSHPSARRGATGQLVDAEGRFRIRVPGDREVQVALYDSRGRRVEGTQTVRVLDATSPIVFRLR